MKQWQKTILYATPALAILWIGTIGTLGWFFLRGKTIPSEDHRIAVLLTHSERNLVLTEMRGLLEALHIIHTSLAENDREKAALAARKVGMQMVSEVADLESSLLLKLPLPMKRLGMGTHEEFDRMALTLQDTSASINDIHRGLEQLTARCVSCHSTYRIEAEAR